MKRIFLASSIGSVASHLHKKISKFGVKRVAFITTACELEDKNTDWIQNDRNSISSLGYDVTDYTFTSKTASQIKQDLTPYDCICIEGGNTFYLLKQIQESRCYAVIHDLIREGRVYIGSSAGSVLAGPSIHPIRHTEPVKESRQLNNYEGLGLVDFVVLPHWGQEYARDLYLNKRMHFNYNDNHKLMLLTDNQYVYVNSKGYSIVDVSKD